MAVLYPLGLSSVLTFNFRVVFFNHDMEGDQHTMLERIINSDHVDEISLFTITCALFVILL